MLYADRVQSWNRKELRLESDLLNLFYIGSTCREERKPATLDPASTLVQAKLRNT